VKGAIYDNKISLTSFFFSVLGSNAAATCKLTLLQSKTDNLKTHKARLSQDNKTQSYLKTLQDKTMSRQYETHRDETGQVETKQDKRREKKTTQDKNKDNTQDNT
jgi:hypothetical protein